MNQDESVSLQNHSKCYFLIGEKSVGYIGVHSNSVLHSSVVCLCKTILLLFLVVITDHGGVFFFYIIYSLFRIEQNSIVHRAPKNMTNSLVITAFY